jgi:hypothetical protein
MDGGKAESPSGRRSQLWSFGRDEKRRAVDKRHPGKERREKAAMHMNDDKWASMKRG